MMIRNMDGTACIHVYAFTYNSIIGRLHVFSNLLSVYGHFSVFVKYYMDSVPFSTHLALLYPNICSVFVDFNSFS